MTIRPIIAVIEDAFLCAEIDKSKFLECLLERFSEIGYDVNLQLNTIAPSSNVKLHKLY